MLFYERNIKLFYSKKGAEDIYLNVDKSTKMERFYSEGC